jgi:hypothetical protein
VENARLAPPALGATTAMPRVASVKRMSLAFAPPGVAIACVPGIAVCLENDCPASVVRSTEPSRSSR